MTAPVRRARGEVQELILHALSVAPAGTRYTPYALAQIIEVTPGSATAAVKRLVQQSKIVCYGISPLVVGK